MDIVDFEPGLTAEWDAFVGAHPLASYGHLSANFALAAHAQTRNASLLVRDAQKTVAVMPLFESTHHTLRAIALREFTSGALFPAGPLISPSLGAKGETAALTLLLDAVDQRARARRIDRVVVAHPAVTAGQPTLTRIGYSPLLHHGYQPNPGVGLLLDLSRSVEQLAAGRNSGCRQRITKAQATGMITSPISDRATWMACHALNLQTLGELALSEEELGAIWDHFIVPGHAIAHGAYMDGALVAVTVTIQSNNTAYYWHGWRPANAPAGASHLALWTSILACRDQGCHYFELGSLEFANARQIGIAQFKQSFGGTPFQVLSARREMKPVKAAAIALAETAIAAYRQRKRAPAAAAKSATASAAVIAPSPRAPAVAVATSGTTVKS
jgi:hypothetical protein